MSLDVYLRGEPKVVPCQCNQCGNKHDSTETETFFRDNITHNLRAMAIAAGIYGFLWRPEEIGITKASQLITPLREGLALLKSNPKRFREFDSPNGWGLYVHFVPFVERYLNACIEHPDANVDVSR